MNLNKDEEQWIKGQEGYSKMPYIDTAGKLTIGWGRNLQDHGVSPDEAELMFQNDLKRATKDLEQFSWYLNAPDNVKKALINMSFNLGLRHLLSFKKMIAALINKNYTNAALEALDSKWAKQESARAKDVVVMMRG
jgi:lysozyme